MAPKRKLGMSCHLNTLPQRSSLRRAIRESLQDAAVVTAASAASGNTFSLRTSSPPAISTSSAVVSSSAARTARGSSQDDNGKKHPNGVPAQRRGWYRVKEIIHEARTAGTPVFLVEWEGHDAKTGMPWPSSWVNAKDVSTTAIREWEAKKTNTA